MRTIKFRAKQTYNNEWVVGNLIYKEAPKRVLENKEPYRNYYIQSQDFTGNLYEVIPETIGQFTGLYDKNGKEIYEGDICSGHSDGNGVIEWEDLSGGYDYVFSNEDIVGIWEVIKDIVVIGNIHENPELLE